MVETGTPWLFPEWVWMSGHVSTFVSMLVVSMLVAVEGYHCYFLWAVEVVRTLVFALWFNTAKAAITVLGEARLNTSLHTDPDPLCLLSVWHEWNTRVSIQGRNSRVCPFLQTMPTLSPSFRVSFLWKMVWVTGQHCYKPMVLVLQIFQASCGPPDHTWSSTELASSSWASQQKSSCALHSSIERPIWSWCA